MTSTFGSIYAHVYDTLYQDKDYAGEAVSIHEVFREHGKEGIRAILDMGCGTGNHAFPLCRAGYAVVGVDWSEHMLAEARRKAAGRKLTVEFHCGDIRRLELDRTFDAALMMFAVLGYQLDNADVVGALKSARRRLRDDGLLVFDVWYGPAVLAQKPSERVKVSPTAEGQVLRSASGTLDSRRHLCTVQYELWELEREQLKAHAKETHRMRYFFPLELELFLEGAGFSLLEIKSFPHRDREADETTWNVLVVARAV